MCNEADAPIPMPEATALATTAITPLSLLQAAINKDADLSIVEKLMDLRDRQENTEARKAYTEAMAQFRADCPVIDRNKAVSFGSGKTSYTHADLAGTIQQIRGLLSECGLSHSWRTEQKDSQITVTCVLTHVMGHSESTSMTAGSDTSGSKNPIQAIGSTVTYLERYTLFALLGLASADQDNDGDTGDGVITDDQVVKLATDLDEIDGKLNQFLMNFNVERLEDIPESQYNRALEMIAGRKAQKAKEAAQ